jgi:hypothetical protein
MRAEMLRRGIPPVTIMAVVLTLAAALPASAQTTSSLTATFQASVAEYPTRLAAPDYRSYGVMLGVERPGRWWSPHLWLQRYDLVNICLDPLPGDSRCKGNGWSLSVGPSIQFLDGASLKGSILPQIGLDSRGNQAFTGGAGLHFGWDAGFFQPQAFGRFQTFRGWSHVTVGAGLRIELASRGDAGTPEPRGFGPGR